MGTIVAHSPRRQVPEYMQPIGENSRYATRLTLHRPGCATLDDRDRAAGPPGLRVISRQTGRTGGSMGVRWRAKGWATRLRRWVLWLVGGFVLLSVAWVLLYAIVAPPVTPLMLIRALGGAGIHRSWVPAAAIDPDVFRAVMA